MTLCFLVPLIKVVFPPVFEETVTFLRIIFSQFISISNPPRAQIPFTVYPSIEKWYEEFKENHAKSPEEKHEMTKEE